MKCEWIETRRSVYFNEIFLKLKSLTRTDRPTSLRAFRLSSHSFHSYDVTMLDSTGWRSVCVPPSHLVTGFTSALSPSSNCNSTGNKTKKSLMIKWVTQTVSVKVTAGSESPPSPHWHRRRAVGAWAAEGVQVRAWLSPKPLRWTCLDRRQTSRQPLWSWRRRASPCVSGVQCVDYLQKTK